MILFTLLLFSFLTFRTFDFAFIDTCVENGFAFLRTILLGHAGKNLTALGIERHVVTFV